MWGWVTDSGEEARFRSKIAVALGVSVDLTSLEVDSLYDGVRQKCLQYVNWAYHITDICKQYYIQELFVQFERENLGVNVKRD